MTFFEKLIHYRLKQLQISIVKKLNQIQEHNNTYLETDTAWNYTLQTQHQFLILYNYSVAVVAELSLIMLAAFQPFARIDIHIPQFF